MSAVNISGSECFWKTFSIGFRSRQNSVPVSVSAIRSSSSLVVCAAGSAALVAQFPPQDLSGRRLRNLVDDLDLARVLVRRHPLLAEGDQLVLACRLALLPRDDRLARLPAAPRPDAETKPCAFSARSCSGPPTTAAWGAAGGPKTPSAPSRGLAFYP